MVTDYVQQLYVPAAQAGRAAAASSAAGAKDLARWKASVRDGWSGVRVDHVESSGVGDSAQIGDVVHVRGFVSLGDLAVDDVEVQVVHGRVSESDELRPSGTVRLAGGVVRRRRHRFEGEFALRQTGPFGYTVRILPRHPGWPRRPSWGSSSTPEPTLDQRPIASRTSSGTVRWGQWPAPRSPRSTASTSGFSPRSTVRSTSRLDRT